MLIHELLAEHDRKNQQSKKPQRKRVSQEVLNLRVCKKKIRNGLFTVAIKLLTSSGIAPVGEDTLKGLHDDHPFAPPPIIPTSPTVYSSVVTSRYMVLGKIRSFPRGTSCGRDGLRVQHLLDALNGSAEAVADELLESITGVINLWFDGFCPAQLGVYIASAPLTPLLKPDCDIRPIVVGTVWRRLMSKVAASAVGKQLCTYLEDFQFGVGVPCGGEAILHSVNRLILDKGHCSYMTTLLVDFRNAFNMHKGFNRATLSVLFFLPLLFILRLK
ncbi:uncharacterized protein LOC113320753 [Papaver somniferum]|uniref:uncharacterized protein LOC113320753 n=1 Tax=Papaver somniferum TaxID=3469 RepID=UPI000E702723|nr:uncharacterized protein LOC113320753 [Papaver somniferum]